MGKRDREASNAGDAGHAAKRKSSKVQKQAAGAAPKEVAAGASADAWRPVEAGEDFHTGLDEDGFMGLEVMEAPKLFSTSKPAPVSSDVDGGGGGGATPAAASGKAGGKAAQAAAGTTPAPGSGGKQKGKKKRKASAGAEGAVVTESTAAAQPASGASPAAAAPGAAPAAAAGDAAAPKPAGPAGGGGVDDEVAAALRARLAEKEKRRQQKLADLKEAARQAALARDEFVMPEGLSRKEQRTLLARHKREKHKAAMKHKKAKIAERRRKYKMKKAARDAGAEGEGGSGSDADGEAPVKPTNKASKPAAAPAAAVPEPTTDVSAWDVFGLHPGILRALAMQGFAAPTPIQEACLMPAIRGRRDIIGAAQTGSGKTLAFGLPIIQRLLAEGAGQGGGHAPRTATPPSPLRGLILLPTRELALQVEQHLRAVAGRCGIGTAAIVGGLSALKQERVLSKRPAIVAATPGRLWDLMQDGGGASKHLTQLQRLDFLVLDEADRMVQQGHYQELGNIVEYVVANRGGGGGGKGRSSGQPQAAGASADGGSADSDSETGDSDSETADSGSDQEAEEAQTSGSSDDDDAAAASPPETDAAPAAGSGSGKQDSSAARPLQTFVFSATLTLPAGLRRRLRKGGGGAGGSGTLETLMDAVPFGERPKVVDLTDQTRRLASGLSEAYLHCDERQRDEFLYYLLVKHPGRTLVFVNAVSATRRLAALLGRLGIPAVALHASQQQRQRLKALDRFKKEPNGVLVATDVAARGLDVPDVRCVVHYQVPASADLYVHRSGRTARAAADGIAVALVTPGDSKRFDALQTALSRPAPPEFPVEEALLPGVHARVGLALRLDAVERAAAKGHADKTWMRAAAEDLGIHVDDAEVASDGEITKGRKRRELLRRMKKAGQKPDRGEEHALRKELARLLAEPLRPGFSQKYFTGGAAGAAAMLLSSGGAAAGTKAQPGDGMMAVVAAAEKLHASHVAAADDVATKQAAAAKRAKRAKAASGAAAGTSDAPQDGGKQRKQKRKAEAANGATADKKDAKNKKRKGGGGGGAAGPAPMGREAGGQDALAALQAQNKA